MVKLTTCTVALTCALLLVSCRALAQDDTPTRRPTPVPTSTRTPTGVSATPTRPPVGTDVFLCSSGSSDGATCDADEDCPNGTCVLTQGVCDGGDKDGDYCDAEAECTGGGHCRAAQRVCRSGASKGVSCLGDAQCPESTCVSTGLFCEGGDFDLFTCIDDGGCDGQFEDGDCRSPTVQLCSAGANDADLCRSSLECPGGACVVSQKICNGGESNGLDCEGEFDCPGGECTTTASICSAGKNKSFGCLNNDNCPGGTCLATGRLCSGGVFDSISCVDNASCSPVGEDPAPCVTPTADFYCSNGTNDGASCTSDDECPGGACVLSQGVCDGGGDDGDLCETNVDCETGRCLQTQMVCLAGDLEGLACLADRNCGSGILCGSSGLFCLDGAFDSLSCVVDENCCDDDGCSATDVDDGFCFAPSVLLCSAGSANNQACDSHFDCPLGACVETQRVCDGGNLDGSDCQGNVNCEGAPCVATSKICIRNGTVDGEVVEVEGFGCLRDDHCFGAGAGSCQPTGQACDGGDTSVAGYDPFSILLTCTDDQICRDFLGDNLLTCRAPTPRGFACSAGANDGQACTTNTDCPQGVCVLQDSLCEGGARDNQLCDTNADCPNGSCRSTQRVCSETGFSCVTTAQCAQGETCISSGRVCNGSTFGAFSCADDANCFDPDDPNAESGVCVGLTPRACSLEAACVLDHPLSGEVFGFSVNPLTSPATFDFYLVPLPAGAAGVGVVLRPSGGDADLYLGRQLTADIGSAVDYPFASNNSSDSTDFVRISPLSTPSFATFTEGIDEFAAAVGGVGGATTYTIEPIFLGPSAPGDADCDGDVDEDDIAGLITVFFDPAARLTADNAPFARCLGADGNEDGGETVADIVEAVSQIGAP